VKTVRETRSDGDTYIGGSATVALVSIEVEVRVVDPGDDAYSEATWDLKQRIRREEGVLKQRRGFFLSAYRRSRSYLCVAGGEVIAFAVSRRDGYVLFLGVAPEHRGEGLGKGLIGRVADDYGTVTCHARGSNEAALGFYRHIGFEEVRHVKNYYEDGGDAYYLRLGDGEGARLLDRIAEFFRR
jgi:ribosomal protein S18 acetylase RimI-like enzyme